MTAGPKDDPTPKRSVVGQHAQSVLLAVITAAVLYSGSFVVQDREDSVRLGGQIASLTTEVAAMRAQIVVMQGNYVSRDDFRDHEARIRLIERAIPAVDGMRRAR